MATNVYFSPKVRTEQTLYEDIIIESLKMYGQDVIYLPRTIVSKDNILMEDLESNFADSYTIEMYIENAEGFEGEGDLMTKFGLEIRDVATFIVSKRRWEQLIGVFNNDLDEAYRPKEGDLVYLPLSRSIFQIDKVEHEQPFYQLNNLPTYKLQCSMYEMDSDDQFDTNIAEIDKIEALKDYQSVILADGFANTTVVIGETVTQTNSNGVVVTGEVVRVDSAGGEPNYYTLEIGLANITTSDGEYHEFVVGSTITTSVSQQTATITAVDTLEGSTDDSIKDGYAQNYEINQEAADFLDFSESNPFGDDSVGGS